MNKSIRYWEMQVSRPLLTQRNVSVLMVGGRPLVVILRHEIREIFNVKHCNNFAIHERIEVDLLFIYP